MHICYDARTIVDLQTGLGNYTYHILKYLLRIDKKNKYTVLINETLRNDHPVIELEQNNLHKKFVRIPEVSFQQQYLIPLKLLQERPNVYHYPNFDLPVLQPFNSVFTVHDLTYIKHKHLYYKGRWLKNYYTEAIMRGGVKKAKKIIVCSKSTKRDLIEIFNVPANKVKVIYHALDEDFLNGVNNYERNLSNLSVPKKLNGVQYFLFVGQMRPHKNLVRIIKSFSKFKEKIPNGYKLIIGGNSYLNYNDPQKTVAEFGLNKDVCFLGYVEEKEIISLYRNAACFVFPSLYEGFGIPILESMAVATPVITSNISSMPEIAGTAAITVNPYSIDDIAAAMVEVVEDKQLRQSLIEKGLKRVTEFSWERAAEQTLKVYEKLSSDTN